MYRRCVILPKRYLTHACFCLCLWGISEGGAAAQTDSLALSSGSGAPGSVVDLNLSLASASSPAAALQWTLTYPAAAISGLSVTVGPAAAAAGKGVSCAGVPGSYTCVLAGLNATAIQEGVVATVAVTTSSSFNGASFGLTGVEGASPEATEVPITGSGSTITGTGSTFGPNSLSPTSGSGLTQTFQFTDTDSDGYAALGGGGILINTAQNGANACWAYYNRAAGSISLAADNGSNWSSIVASSGQTLQNSQCTVTAASGSGSGDTLQVSVSITFSPSFAGTKNVYAYALNTGGTASAFAQLGTWTVPGSGSNAGGVTPSSGSGLAQVFQLSFNGAGDLGGAILFNSSMNGVNGCWVYYDGGYGRYLLAADNMRSWSYLPAGGSVSNSQCTVTDASASSTADGLQVTVSITFKSAFAGSKNIYMYALEANGARSPFQQVGTWTVP